MGTTPNYTADLAALASELCDLWQEHLASIAADPRARAELAAMLEPQRQFFKAQLGGMTGKNPPDFMKAAWGMPFGGMPFFDPEMMGSFFEKQYEGRQEGHNDEKSAQSKDKSGATPGTTSPKPAEAQGGPQAPAASSDDGSLRMAQFAYRLAALERRIDQIEQQMVHGKKRRARKDTEFAEEGGN